MKAAFGDQALALNPRLFSISRHIKHTDTSNILQRRLQANQSKDHVSEAPCQIKQAGFFFPRCMMLAVLSGFLHINSPIVLSVLFQIHVYQCLRSLNLFRRSPKRQHLEVQKLPFTMSACTEKPPLHLLSRTQLLHEGTYICNPLRLKNEDYIRMSKGRK